jgi:hypothetical protein
MTIVTGQVARERPYEDHGQGDRQDLLVQAHHVILGGEPDPGRVPPKQKVGGALADPSRWRFVAAARRRGTHQPPTHWWLKVQRAPSRIVDSAAIATAMTTNQTQNPALTSSQNVTGSLAGREGRGWDRSCMFPVVMAPPLPQLRHLVAHPICYCGLATANIA